MLSQDQLTKFATKYQTSELNVRREYIQHVLLSYLYQQPHIDSLFFKGGTALKLVYQSPRFSEDLDFDASIHQINVWETVIESMLINVSREGIKVDVSESTQTSGGYLAIISVAVDNQVINIKFEISFRQKTSAGEITAITNDFIPSYPVKCLNLPHLVDGKLNALFERQKARDFYDLYFLLRSNFIPPEKKQNLSLAKSLLEKSHLNFERELSLFLPRSQALLIRNFKHSLTQELNRHI